jgi:hypothetical protein
MLAHFKLLHFIIKLKMRHQIKTKTLHNPSVRFTASSDEEKQIALLEKEWLERQMYISDDRGFYCGY